ncbi:Z1 domain-containing protein [Mediterranea massiliensis]|uniref:Z1 domain-containing protein n=2 Tax=Mediterranea massiliensis TaxID=1841865 RepID=UPI00320914B2
MNNVKEWIKTERDTGKSWDDLRYAGETNEQELIDFLKYASKKMHWPALSAEEWYKFVEQQRNIEENLEKLIDKKGVTVIRATNEQNQIKVSKDEDSAWQCYKRLLLRNKGFKEEVVNVMEDANIKILHQLSGNTRESGAIKGLVIGNVQSGKTANMAALMAMAADNGWNMFIVLSGMMENLRVQTLKRLVEDLNSRNCNMNWEAIDNPQPIEQYGKRLIDKNFTKESKMRFLAVCLKNSSRLSNLIDWLNSDLNSRKDIRLLIIDDEADQASINTATQDQRTAINRLILNLINNRNSRGQQACCKFQAVNYVGYTATPYANVLNEAPGPESLYPSNFIATLSVSDEYFGPQQIFGYESDDDDSTSFPGLDIVRLIPDNDIININNIQRGTINDIPNSLTDAICWFLCGVAYMRYVGYRKPISMLIHTSRKTESHSNMGNAIKHFFNSQRKEDIIEACSNIWASETNRFSRTNFMTQYYNYANISNINDYPEFEELRQCLIGLLSSGLTQIEVNSDNNQIKYKTGIHLCIDNSDKNNDNSRLIYPNENEMPNVAPVFLIIGGNTLSRGLTIEGLICTYFLRPAGCADTLMQMGRWFGYRKGYELIPRIWLSRRVRDQFRFISEMDQKLRNEIKFMAGIGQNPSECGPKIMASPSTNFLKIVSDNKMQGAVGATYDFAGHTMETGVFTNDEEMLNSNLQHLSQFIQSLGAPSDVQNNPYAANNKIWKNIDSQIIKDFLNNYQYSERLNGFNDLKVFTGWLDRVSNEGLLGNWDVILAGIRHNENLGNRQITDTISINKVNRTRRYEDTGDGIINIGTLRSFNDFLSDISVENEGTLSAMKNVQHNMAALNLLRENLGMSTIPQLVIYIIDKNSQPNNNNNRYPLNAMEDIVGFSINIPGIRKGNSTIQTLTININPTNLEDPGI